MQCFVLGEKQTNNIKVFPKIFFFLLLSETIEERLKCINTLYSDSIIDRMAGLIIAKTEIVNLLFPKQNLIVSMKENIRFWTTEIKQNSVYLLFNQC